MHGIATGSPASIDKEWLILLVLVQDKLKIAMRKDDLPPQKTMRLLARDTLKPLKQGIVNELGPELVNQLVVVDRFHLAVLANLARHAPGIDILLMWFWDSWLGRFCFCHGDWEILWWGREMSQRSANNEVTRVRGVCKL